MRRMIAGEKWWSFYIKLEFMYISDTNKARVNDYTKQGQK